MTQHSRTVTKAVVDVFISIDINQSCSLTMSHVYGMLVDDTPPIVNCSGGYMLPAQFSHLVRFWCFVGFHLLAPH